MVPAAVTQERSGWGERKKARAGIEVWVSSMSANHSDQLRQTSSVCSSRSMTARR